MSVHEYASTVVKRWRVVIACLFLGLSLAALMTLSVTPTYEARTQLLVSVPTGNNDVATASQGSNFTQQRIASYAAIANSPLVLDPVVEALSLTGSSAASLASRVVATVPSGTNLLTIQVADASAENAARVASAIATQFAEVITDLETPANGETSLVRVTVVQNASVPGTPVSPNAQLNLAVGFVLGAFAGVAAAVVRESLDTTVKGPDDIEAVSQSIDRPLNVIGNIVKDPKASKVPLIINADPQSKRAEAFRQLRTNLQFVDVDNPPRSIVITSSLAVEGKSTTSANLAIALAQAGLRVSLIEADLRRPKLADYMGVENAVGLTDVLIGRAKASDLMQPWGGLPLNFLPSGRPAPNPSELLGSRTMLNLLQDLEKQSDIVLLDAPPLLPVTDAAVMSALAGGALLVVRVGSTTRDQVEEAAEALEAVDARLLGVVMNMVPGRSKRAGYEYKYDYPATARRAGSTGRAAPATTTRSARRSQLVVPGGQTRSKGRRS